MGVWGLPPEKCFGATPLRCSENEGNALFCYILHHKHDYIEQQNRQDALFNLDQVTKKAKEFLYNYKRSNISSTKYERDLLSSPAK